MSDKKTKNTTEKKVKDAAEGKAWKIVKIINLILTGLYLVCSAVLMTKIFKMGILPGRYFAIAVIGLLIVPVLSILLRNKKPAMIIFIILNIAFALLLFKGYTMVDKVDDTIGRVTENGDLEVTVMEIRVLADNKATSEAELKEYTIGIMKERDRKYADKVLESIKESIGREPTVVETEDDPSVLIKALYSGEVDAIIINSTYAGIFDETEEFSTFSKDTKVIKEFEIEERIKKRTEDIANSENESQTESESQNNGGNGNGNGGGYDYGQYGEDGGGFVYIEPTEPYEMDKDAFVVYISGIDTYGNVNRKSRSDVNILMAVNTKTKKVVMVNTPRDYYVPLSVSNGVKDKLTHAGNFGVECSRDTLGMLYGVTAEYYVRMNFTGFIDIIDAIGGIDVNSEYSFSAGGRNFTSGMNYNLTGRQALAFARERKSFASGDRQRGKNQMAVITAMIKKMATAEIVTNYNAVLDAIAGSFQTNFTSQEIYALVHMQIDDMAVWNVESYSVDGTGAMLPTYSVPGMNLYVMEPDMDTVKVARDKIKAVLTGN